jgi:hypothetical protein
MDEDDLDDFEYFNRDEEEAEILGRSEDCSGSDFNSTEAGK